MPSISTSRNKYFNQYVWVIGFCTCNHDCPMRFAKAETSNSHEWLKEDCWSTSKKKSNGSSPSGWIYFSAIGAVINPILSTGGCSQCYPHSSWQNWGIDRVDVISADNQEIVHCIRQMKNYVGEQKALGQIKGKRNSTIKIDIVYWIQLFIPLLSQFRLIAVRLMILIWSRMLDAYWNNAGDTNYRSALRKSQTIKLNNRVLSSQNSRKERPNQICRWYEIVRNDE